MKINTLLTLLNCCCLRLLWGVLLLLTTFGAARGQQADGGYDHTVAIYPNGTLWTWGNNNRGQLGDGTLTQHALPRQLAIGSTWLSANANHEFSLAIRSDGTLWGWGANYYGQLGDGTTTDRMAPVQVGTVTTWKSVAAGGAFAIAIRTDGTLWSWGHNDYGQLGDGTLVPQRNTPLQVGTATNWKSVVASNQHILAVRTDGTLWAWGNNNNGQLGDGTYTIRNSPVQVGVATNWESFAVGSNFSLAIRTNGTLWSWGVNGLGQLGDGTYGFGRNAPGQVGSATTWKSVSAGNEYTVAVRTDGTLWSWGGNGAGQLGDGTAGFYRSTPQQAGTISTWQAVFAAYEHVLASRTDGSLWGWGSNDTGQVGSNAIPTALSFFPEQVGTTITWQGVAAGGLHSVAVRTDGTLWTWGADSYGQLGNGPPGQQNVPLQIGTATTWQGVAASEKHTAAVRTDGTLWTWGNNDYGQLGNGTTTQRTSPVQVGTATTWQSVTTGNSCTLAIRQDGTLWAWGYNGGQLGDGTITTRLAPVQIGTATTWKSVKAGNYHTLAVRTDGTLWAWGNNTYGQLGDGTATLRMAPVQIGTATTWKSVAAGTDYSLALRTDSTLWAWGANGYGQLGDGTTTTHGIPGRIGTATWLGIAAAGSYGSGGHSLAVRADGTLWSWGKNDNAQLGDGTAVQHATPAQVGTATTWQGVAAGYQHSLAVRTDGTLWAWGENYSGQIGNNLAYYSHVPRLIYPLTVTAVRTSSPTSTLQLLPNPAHEQVLLPELGANAELRLLDLQGRLVRTGTGTQLSLHNLSPGLYLLQASTPAQTPRIARLVVE